MTSTSTPVKDRSTGVNIDIVITVLASVLTVLLTATAFWLSYEHLQFVAARHGMADAAVRSWAWPATVDLFIVIGELLILRASLAKRVDWWAIGLATTGSTGSIALNVAGVGDAASRMDYVVAAVPPVAALLAFGALMRQVHAYLAARVSTPVNTASTPVNVSVDRAPAADTVQVAAAAPGRLELPPTGACVNRPSTAVDLCMPVIYPNRVDQLIRAVYGTDFVEPDTSRMVTAMRAAGLGDSESTARTARKRVKAREPHLASFPRPISA